MSEAPLGKIGDYRLVRKLGEGAMGEVYEVYLDGEDRRYAIKVLSAELSAQKDKVERFRREMEALTKLDHDNIVKAYHFGQEGNRYYFVMDYVEGESMDRIILRQGISIVNSAKYTIQAARALDHAHKKGVVHRDIKPSNLMVGLKNQVFLTDFGIARDTSALALTAQGQVMGTPNYMSPEQALGKSELMDGRSDLYSLAATFYEMLTRTVPFTAENPRAVLKKVVDEDPIPLSRINGRVPRSLELIVLKGLRKKPARRYATGKAFAEDVQRWLDGKTVEARPETPVEKAVRFVSRHRSFSIMGVVFIVALTGFLVFLQVMADSREADRLRLLDKQQKKITAVVKKAGALLKKGSFDKARIQYRKALEIDPKNVDAAIGLDRVDEAVDRVREERIVLESRDKARKTALKAESLILEGDVVFRERVKIVGAIRDILSFPKVGKPGKGDNYEGSDLNALQIKLAAMRLRGNTAYLRALKAFGNALAEDPQCAEAHQGMARIFLSFAKGHLYEAEETNDYGVVQQDVILVEQHDKAGLHATELDGIRRILAWTRDISFAVTPVQATLSLITCRLTAGEYSPPRSISHRDVTLPAGSYIVVIEADGYVPARVPVLLRRPGFGRPLEVPAVRISVELYPESEALEGMVFVAPGAFLFGGRLGLRGGKREEKTLPGFFIERTEVRNRDYRSFLDSIKETGDLSHFHDATPKALRGPHEPLQWATEGGAEPDLPVVGISWFEASAYAAWKKRRLPTNMEWEKAARGVDGRAYPWGLHFDETRCVHRRNPDLAVLSQVGSLPLGQSPYGVLDMAGNAGEWVNKQFYTTEYFYILGGSFRDPLDILRCPSRDMANRKSRLPSVGFRCAMNP